MSGGLDKTKPELTLPEVYTAARRLKGVIHRTLLDHSHTFSSITGCETYLKLENLQKTGSFKIRGAYNKIQTLTPEERACGVIAASAGNHAQGVAYAAAQAGIPSVIVMPEHAPLAKVVATKGYGAEVVLAGATYDESYEHACRLQRERGLVFVHAFNDPCVMAGQGTIGLEILEDLQDLEAIVVPVGGGGLISGIALAVKQVAPHVKVYGVQAAGAPAMHLSKRAGCYQTTDCAVTIADGIAVKQPGDLTYDIVQKYVDDVVIVEDEEIAETILLLLERSKLMVEGAGATSLAALLFQKLSCKGKVAAVLSGGNIDVNFISQIIEHGLVKSGRRVKILTRIADRPGELSRLLDRIAQLHGNVMQVFHDRAERCLPLGQAVVEISLETRDEAHCQSILEDLTARGYEVERD